MLISSNIFSHDDCDVKPEELRAEAESAPPGSIQVLDNQAWDTKHMDTIVSVGLVPIQLMQTAVARHSEQES